ncbi:inverse autotransporter beta domain-containing protein [Kluyvera sp. CRP]|uniref:inverse autotransporter beta domain-containing protein n=1 Tax=Kluyvera sp. CRP TaxID=2873269 RepID=UPI001CC1CD32|nr:inverse autotransporter beta domain-containing protein [Kluyvera sp. CRP]
MPPLVKLLTWFNIGVQVSFPLAMAFTPAIAGTGSDGRFLQRQAQTEWHTRVYTLGEGESVSSVARKYNMSLDSLRTLNQFRTFARGFDHLQAGDELDVPVAPLPEVRWDDAPATSAPGQNNEDTQANKVAGYASQAGSFLANNPNGDAAASMARGMVTGAAGSEIQQWLSRFGTARLQLDADKNFSLKNSQLDLLVPLYEQKDSLVFTQGSIHRTDDRTQSNLGLGYRWFAADWMLGASTFLDYDLSRDHARLGLGGEYWRDFLKLGVNTYHRLTGWKSSPDLEDYEERPANGWDVRAQYWLPALPQLGGKLTYEQYYGNEVALFGRDNRQRNPHAITAGVNYTPVPLLTFSAEQRQGQSGKSDTRFSVDMNYQLGMPWQHQINPDAVAAMRSLAGSRYDLVDRNNNIVLEYRKKEVIRLKTADLVTGYAGEQKSLGVSVNSRHGLERIDWSASPLIAAGGKIVQNGSDWTVVMPGYRSGAEGVNSYTVSGVAVDIKGNVSDRAETQVTVQAPLVSAEKSTFTPASSMLPADGKSTQVLTLAVRDAEGQAVSIPAEEIVIKTGELHTATVSAPVQKDAGVFEVTVTAGTGRESVTVTPEIGGQKVSAATVTISSLSPDAERTTFTASPETIAADGHDISTLTLSARDDAGSPLSGIKGNLSFVVTPEGVSGRSALPLALSDISEPEGDGVYVATLAGSVPGRYTIRPYYNGEPVGQIAVKVVLKASAPDEAKSVIDTDATTYTAGADMRVTVTLKDAQDNAVTGASSSLTAETVTVPNATLKGSGWAESPDGTYTATYTAKTVSTNNQATLKLSGWSEPAKSGAYAITAGAVAQAKSVIDTDATTYTAGADMRVTVTLKDAQDNAVTGASSSLTAETVTVPNATLKGSGWAESPDGTYTATYTAKTVSTNNQATLKLSGWSEPAKSGAYAITAGAVAQAKSVIDTDATTYTAGADMRVTVTLKDAQDNAVTGASSSLTAETVTVPNATLKGSGWAESPDGTYTATYTAKTVSTNNQATLKLSGWSEPAKSGAYAITAGAVAQAKSVIDTDATTYTAGADMRVTVTLKDAQDNAVTGASSSLTADAVEVPNATLKGSGWAESPDGTYTATYTAKTVSTNNQATLKLSGWSEPAKSGAYAITENTEGPASIRTQLNDFSFDQNSEIGTFPTTGFDGATFTIVPKDGKNVADYNWSSDTTWAKVGETNGIVTFKGKGTGVKVTITGTPTSGQGKTIKYSFTLNKWFEFLSGTKHHAEAVAACKNDGGLPTLSEFYRTSNRDTSGGLWNEWGNTENYGFSGSIYWASDESSFSGYYWAFFVKGPNGAAISDLIPVYVVCRQGL